MVYPALLPLMRTNRLPVVDWTDAPADLNGLVRFAERRNLVSARVPSYFKRSLLRTFYSVQWYWNIPLFARKLSLCISRYIPDMRLNKEGNIIIILKPLYTAVLLDSKQLSPKYLQCYCVTTFRPLNKATLRKNTEPKASSRRRCPSTFWTVIQHICYIARYSAFFNRFWRPSFYSSARYFTMT